MDEKFQKEDITVLKEEKFVPPNPPPESDWRLGKYFDAMNNIEGYPEPPEFEEIGGYLSNCTDTDMDESASVLYAYNYLKEYVKHMKSAKEAKNNLMSVLPSQEGMSPNYTQDSDTSPEGYHNAQGIHCTTPDDDMDDCYDHLSTKEETYYASMNMRADYKPHLEVRRTSSEGQEIIGHRNGYAIPYITRHCTVPPNLRPPIKGTVSCNYPDNKPRCEQAEVVEICSPSDTSLCSAPYWMHQRGAGSKIVYESIDKLELTRNESDEYFIPRAKDKQSTTDSSNSHHHMPPEANRTNQKKRKSKRPNNRAKVYVTTNRVFHQPIIHSKECLDSLNSDEVRPCDCLKTVPANQKNKSQHSPLKHVHVMESIQDGEISNFNTIMKKKLDRTHGVDDWTVPYPDYTKHRNPSSNNSSDNTYADDFDTYDRASNHAFASRSLTSYAYSQGNGSIDTDSMLAQSYTHQPYSPNKENFVDKSEEMSRSMMYMPSQRWNFAFVPYEPVKNGKPNVTRYHSNDIVTSDNKSSERLTNSGEFKSNSSFASKASSKSDRSSSCSSRGSSSTSEPKERKHFTKAFFKTLSPKLLKNKSYNGKSPARGQVSEL